MKVVKIIVTVLNLICLFGLSNALEEQSPKNGCGVKIFLILYAVTTSLMWW